MLAQGYEIISTIDSWADSYLQNDGEVVLIAIRSKNNMLNFVAHERQRLKYNQIYDFIDLPVILY